MSKLVVRCFGHSLDGFSAGLEQSQQEPFGKKGAIHIMDWFFPTNTFKTMFGNGGGTTGLDDEYASQAQHNVGASIMGRNMFSPQRGPWDESWKGWWGENPPFHHPVFILTHHARPSLEMKGGTTFHFVTDGPDSALRQAQAAAKGQDVRINGGVATVRHYWKAGQIDELHLVQAPLMLGAGERLFEDLGEVGQRYQVAKFQASEAAVHYTIAKKAT